MNRTRAHFGRRLDVVVCVAAAAWTGSGLAAESPDGDPGRIGPGDWVQYNYDVRGTRHNPAEVVLGRENAPRIKELWRFPSRASGQSIGVVHATPVVADGYVFVGTASDRPTFYKLSPDGHPVWQYDIPEGMSPTDERADFIQRSLLGTLADGAFNSALVTETRVYFGTFSGQIICLDRFTGEEVWRILTKDPPFPGAHVANIVMSAPILADGKVIVAGGGFEHSLPTVPEYECCSGRGFVVALDPASGSVIWKYDVSPEPERFDPPLELEHDWGTSVFHWGPSTSSVWSTPTYDQERGLLFFGTDTNNAPRRPTAGDGRLHTEYSCAIIAVDVKDGRERWVTQLVAGDVWNYTMRAYDSRTGLYKDLSIGDSPKLYEIEHRDATVPVVGVGCKDGVFYVLDRRNGRMLHETPGYEGPPTPGTRASAESRVLAVRCPIGGLQTGCAFDGRRVYVNGIDFPTFGTQSDPSLGRYWPPTGGRVTALRPDTLAEFWRHERPPCRTPRFDFPDREIVSGDPVGSGIALANGLAFFTTTVSGSLVVVDAETGTVLNQFDLGPVWCGPSISRGRVYVGGGNRLFAAEPVPGLTRFQFPKSDQGAVHCFGLADE